MRAKQAVILLGLAGLLFPSLGASEEPPKIAIVDLEKRACPALADLRQGLAVARDGRDRDAVAVGLDAEDARVGLCRTGDQDGDWQRGNEARKKLVTHPPCPAPAGRQPANTQLHCSPRLFDHASLMN